MNRVCLVTTSHVSCNPRLLKEANALKGTGYEVRVVAINADAWKWRLDQALAAAGTGWKLEALTAQRHGLGRGLWLRGALRQKLYRRFRLFRSCSQGFERAYSRFAPEFTQLVARERADLFVAHTLQALPAAVAAAKKWRTKAGIDFEDFFSGMNCDSLLEHDLVAAIEAKYVPACHYLTAASPGVSAAVSKRYACAPPFPILNVFPLAERPKIRPLSNSRGPLRLYWFSQTIGHDRGLTDAVRASALLPRGTVELHLRGNYNEAGKRYVTQVMRESRLEPNALVIHSPEPPERMVALAAEYDVGLALEEPVSENRIICMNDLCTNKVFTYLLAGLALTASGIGEVRPVYEGAGFAYPHGQPDKLAAIWKRWHDDRAALQRAKNVAWRLGDTRFNWDTEKATLFKAVSQTLSEN